MDGQKLTRNQSSSLLRSSPSVRSSIHSMASVNEECLIKTQEAELEEEKIRDEKRKPKPKPKPHRSGSISNTKRRSGPNRFGFFKFCFFTVFCLSFLYYLRREEMPTSENLLLALIFIGIALYVGSRNKCLINRNLSLIKQLCVDSKNRLCFFTSRTKSKPVQWYIGDSNPETVAETWEGKKIIREGVEFYSNGDFYEGEFHKGKCNGSGVYNFFVNGRYEGDWVDGRYDGYGIESWAKGSKYRGQYRQGIRHGYGVYRFYTGDSYAGEWCNGQSHGVGVQSCSDGSCYVGEFKYGAKHGLGVYNFRNGDRYAGEYFGDRIHGFGVYHFVNGHCYEGSWHEGRKQGYGVYTFRNGVARCGEWDGGTLKNPLPPLTETVIRAVQAARKAADNAMRFRRVDELVNKAVQAANRAAVAARVAAVQAVQNQKDGRFCNADV